MGKGGAARPVVAAIERERLREIERQLPLSNRPTAQRAFCSCGPRAQPKQEQKAQFGPTREKEGGWVTNNYGQISQISINKQRWLSETGKNLFSSQYKCHKQVNKMDFSEMKMFEQHHNPTQILFHTIGDKKERHSEYTKALTNTDHMLMMHDHLHYYG